MERLGIRLKKQLISLLQNSIRLSKQCIQHWSNIGLQMQNANFENFSRSLLRFFSKYLLRSRNEVINFSIFKGKLFCISAINERTVFYKTFYGILGRVHNSSFVLNGFHCQKQSKEVGSLTFN